MIDSRREQEAVLTIEPFLVRTVAPRLCVARDQVLCRSTPVTRHALSTLWTFCRNNPWPRRAWTNDMRSVSPRTKFSVMSASSRLSHSSTVGSGAGEIRSEL